MTTQDAYEAIRAWFLDPTVPYGYANGACVYRGDEEATSPIRCAAGCLIPDKDYRPDWEGSGSDKVIEALPVHFLEVDADFLDKAQCLHDSAAINGIPRERFIHDLDSLADHCSLEVVPV